jgi:hypothetical protein
MRNQEANETVEANMGKGGKAKRITFYFPPYFVCEPVLVFKA